MDLCDPENFPGVMEELEQFQRKGARLESLDDVLRTLYDRYDGPGIVGHEGCAHYAWELLRQEYEEVEEAAMEEEEELDGR